MPAYFESGMFVGEPAWHKLGTVVKEAPSCADALQLAGLDWHVDERPLVDGVSFEIVKGHKLLTRSTDGRALGVVGDRYKPLQNVKAFGFFEPAVRDGLIKLETAGSLQDGKRVWILAKANVDDAEIVKGDPVRPYLLLYHAHDGSLAVAIMWTPIRVVCYNTASMALSDAERDRTVLKVRHTTNMLDTLEALQSFVDYGAQSFQVSVENYKALARHQLAVKGLEQYVRDVFQVPIEADMPRAWAKIEELHETGPGSQIPGVEGTLWGAYNAITAWTAHERGRSDDSRLNANWFGDGAKIRDRALETALALL